MTYWKVLDVQRRPIHGGDGQWHPNAWMPTIHNPNPCVRGYHLCRRGDLVSWLGSVIWEAKPGDLVIVDGNKVVTDRARLVRRLDTWNDRTARLFAADCAERALALVADPDPRSLKAVRVARLFAEGEATTDELVAAATAAGAATDAAWAADGDAVKAAAWDAAWAAAWAAATAAAGAAAGDAAWAAAWAAATDAAGAADGDAAKAAAWDAAWAAAGDAERAWQTDRLMHYLYPEGEPT